MGDLGREILKRIDQQQPLSLISKELGISEALLKARIESFIHQGFLASRAYASGCASCPFQCKDDTCTSSFSMISLTQKGKSYLKTS